VLLQLETVTEFGFGQIGFDFFSVLLAQCYAVVVLAVASCLCLSPA